MAVASPFMTLDTSASIERSTRLAGPFRTPRQGLAFLIASALIGIAIVGAVCTPQSPTRNAGNDAQTSSTWANTQYSRPGPYAAGTARVTMPNGDRVQIWYPANRAEVQGKTNYTYQLASWIPTASVAHLAMVDLPDSMLTDSYLHVPVATGTATSGNPNRGFPVLLFSHGYGAYPEQSTFLTDHLATWGFVIAAPDHLSRDINATLFDPVAPAGEPTMADPDVVDLENTLLLLRSQDYDPSSFLYSKLDFTKVGVIGNSAGGGTALTLAAGDPVIKTYVLLASTLRIAPFTSVSKPGLVMYGSSDTIVSPADSQQVYAALPTPKRLLVIAGAGRNAFSDLCQIHSGGLRLVNLLKSNANATGPLKLLATWGDDGCFPPDVSPTSVWPLIDQVVTAQMRYGLGIDPTPSGLNLGLDHAYPGVRVAYYQKP